MEPWLRLGFKPNCFAPFSQQVLVNSGSVGAQGVNVKWLLPWYPDKALQVTVKLLSKRLSSKSNDRGYIGHGVRGKS